MVLVQTYFEREWNLVGFFLIEERPYLVGKM